MRVHVCVCDREAVGKGPLELSGPTGVRIQESQVSLRNVYWLGRGREGGLSSCLCPELGAVLPVLVELRAGKRNWVTEGQIAGIVLD